MTDRPSGDATPTADNGPADERPDLLEPAIRELRAFAGADPYRPLEVAAKRVLDDRDRLAAELARLRRDGCYPAPSVQSAATCNLPAAPVPVSDQPGSWENLGAAVTRRRAHLGNLTQKQVADSGGPSTETLRLIEGAHQQAYSPRVLASLERALRWAPGTVDDLLSEALSVAESVRVPVSVPDRPALGTPRQPLTTTGEILAALAQVEADAEVNPDPHPLAEAVIIPDRPDTQTGDGPGLSGPVPAQPAAHPDLIDGQGNRWVWNPDGYRTRPSSTRIWTRAEIERRWPPVVEAGPAAEQPVQPGPDVLAHPFWPGGSQGRCVKCEEPESRRWHDVGAGGPEASAPVESAPVPVEIRAEDLKITAYETRWSGDYVVVVHHVPSGLTFASASERAQLQNKAKCLEQLQAALAAPAPDRVVSDPGRERERLWIDPPSDRPQDERRAGLSWDQVCDAVSDHVFAYPNPDHSTDWCINATGAVDAIWALLARPEREDDDA